MTQINARPTAPVFCTRTLVIHARPGLVWSILTDVNSWPSWHPLISRAHMNAPLPAPGGRFTWKVNGASINSVFHTVEPCRLLGWTGTTLGGSAIHNWFMAEHGEGTQIRVEESMEGWLVRLFKKKMNASLAADMEAWLGNLKRKAEQMEVPAR